jgi:N-acetylglutamate synthase-like GNAT family acetyltransferase
LRGLRLFVRPIEVADHAEITAFLKREDRDDRLSYDCGLLGKLLGEIVAVVTLGLTPDEVRIDGIVVARDLRKKRIGRVMVTEVEQLASKMDRRRVVVKDARDAHGFFRQLGFRSEGERWVRDVI